MAGLKEIRNRIKAVRSTRKITSAMSRIAAARLRRAQNAVQAARPYGKRIQEMLDRLLAGSELEGDVDHVLLMSRPVRRVGIVVISADRGLCGAFNSNVNRAAQRLVEEHRGHGHEVELVTIGKKARMYLQHRAFTIRSHHDAPNLDALIARSKAIAHEAIDMFDNKHSERSVDTVFLVYNHFKNVLTQELRVVKLLPIASESAQRPRLEPILEPILEPARRPLLQHVLPIWVESTIQQAMFDSIAAEIAARRAAMDAATDNASQLIANLTLRYNRERQAAITKELLEIIGGAEALRG